MNDVVKKEDDSLEDDLKQAALEIAEDAAVVTIKVLFKIIPVLAKRLPEKIKPVAMYLLGPILLLEPKALEWADKIDGKVG